MPAVNQIELNPFFIQRDLRNTHEDLGIVTQSWSPIGGVSRNAIAARQAARNPLEHPVIVGLGGKGREYPAQIVLRWHIEHGLSAIPKSVRPDELSRTSGSSRSR